jgi:ankyrin repeat protein
MDLAIERHHIDVIRALVRGGARVSGQVLPNISRLNDPYNNKKDGNTPRDYSAAAKLESECSMFRQTAVTWQLTALIIQEEWEKKNTDI